MTYRHEGQKRRISGREDSSLLVQPQLCTGQRRELGSLLLVIWKGFVEATSEGDQGGGRCAFLVSALDANTKEMAYFFDLVSSNTSKTCSTRLFAVRSSLPTVTRTGSRWNEAASFRTESGHVALTRGMCERLKIRMGSQHFLRTH